MDILPVILCSGSGSRLWPQSRSLYPKQFLPLVNDRTMLQNTVARLQGTAGASAPLVIAKETRVRSLATKPGPGLSSCIEEHQTTTGPRKRRYAI